MLMLMCANPHLLLPMNVHMKISPQNPTYLFDLINVRKMQNAINVCCFLSFHYCILCLFAKGQTKNLKVLRKKNKKPEGFAKEKKSAKFAMRSASQLVAHHLSQI
jgi:hypothetical protein